MAKLQLVCDKCNTYKFEIQKDVEYSNTRYECICSHCGKRIATVDNYSVNWVTEEEDTDDSNPTA